MMGDRAQRAVPLLKSTGAYQCHIDENEYESLHKLFDSLLLDDAGTIVWDKKNPMLGRKGVATQHEYICWRGWNDGPVYLQSKAVKLILSQAQTIIKKHGGVTPESRKEFSQWISNAPDLTGGERAYRLLDDNGRVFQSVAMGAPEPRSNEKFHRALIHPSTGKTCPVPPNGWSRAPETIQNLIDQGEILFGQDETTQPRKKVYLTEDSKRQVSSVIVDAGRGKNDVLAFGLEFPYCHPVSLYETLLGAGAPADGTILDFFAGSGTSGHATINLNRADKGRRKYILVELGDHCDDVLIPRIQKAVFAKEWKKGLPLSLESGISHCFKYIRLESYEDCLNNLQLSRSEAQDQLLIQHDDLREDYMLNYMLDVEAKGSVLNIDAFEDPFAYKMNIAAGTVGETKPVTVDLVETFNYLIGLKVKHIDNIRDVRVIAGENLDGDRILVLWRKVKELDSDALDEWFKKQGYNTQDMEFDLIYVNGDNNLENLKKDEQTWKVRLIEDEFQRLMFEEVE